MPLPSEQAAAGKTDDPETYFVVHDDQGRILRAGTAPLSAVPWQALEGERVAVTLHPADPQAWRVVDGALVPIPDPPSPAHVFDYGAGAWMLDEAKATALLDEAKRMAVAEVAAAIDAVADRITGAVPLVERLSWGSKEVAARAVLAEQATPEQAAMIAGEAAMTGEGIADLADLIVANADAYREAVAAMAGLRREAEAAINAAQDAAGIEAALSGLSGALEQIGT